MQEWLKTPQFHLPSENRCAKKLEKEDEDLQRAMNDSLLNSSLNFIPEEPKNLFLMSESSKRRFDQVSDSDQDEKCSKTRKSEEEEDLKRAIELSKIEFESSASAPDFASSNTSLITNNNTIFYHDAKDPFGVADDPKFNYQVKFKIE